MKYSKVFYSFLSFSAFSLGMGLIQENRTEATGYKTFCSCTCTIPDGNGGSTTANPYWRILGENPTAADCVAATTGEDGTCEGASSISCEVITHHERVIEQRLNSDQLPGTSQGLY